MRTVVEVGDWEHECCGPAYERDSVVELTCLLVPAQGGGGTRYVESHHDLDSEHGAVRLRGRVVDILVRQPDGSAEPIARLPSGRALRGFDEQDDGHLESPGTGEPVISGSHEFLVALES